MVFWKGLGYLGHVVRFERWARSMDIVFYHDEWGYVDALNMDRPQVTVVCPD
jgi:hypothetical protein